MYLLDHIHPVLNFIVFRQKFWRVYIHHCFVTDDNTRTCNICCTPRFNLSVLRHECPVLCKLRRVFNRYFSNIASIPKCLTYELNLETAPAATCTPTCARKTSSRTTICHGNRSKRGNTRCPRFRGYKVILSRLVRMSLRTNNGTESFSEWSAIWKTEKNSITYRIIIMSHTAGEGYTQQVQRRSDFKVQRHKVQRRSDDSGTEGCGMVIALNEEGEKEKKRESVADALSLSYVYRAIKMNRRLKRPNRTLEILDRTHGIQNPGRD